MQKTIFIDIDGTLRNSKRELTPKVIESVKKATKRGIQVVLCSARSRVYTKMIKEACGAGPWMINSNGAEIYHGETKQILHQIGMPKDACKKLYEIASKHQIGFEMFTDDKIVYINNPAVEIDAKERLQEPIDIFLEKNIVVQCVISDRNFELMKSLKNEIEAIEQVEVKNRSKSLLYSNLPPKGIIYYNLNATQASKGNAISTFCRHLGIHREDTIAIGDSVNDISMFDVVGKGVAMGNALPIVKEHADSITLGNDEDGVAVFLNAL